MAVLIAEFVSALRISEKSAPDCHSLLFDLFTRSKDDLAFPKFWVTGNKNLPGSATPVLDLMHRGRQ